MWFLFILILFMESPGTLFGLIAVIFTGFFAIIRYLMNFTERTNTNNMAYMEKKDAHIERISNNFSETISEHQKVTTDLSTKIGHMNDNDAQILKALERNSHTLDRALIIIDLQEKNTALKTVQKIEESKERQLQHQG
jgi:hypothetical protein